LGIDSHPDNQDAYAGGWWFAMKIAIKGRSAGEVRIRDHRGENVEVDSTAFKDAVVDNTKLCWQTATRN
jgi:hypothetical protein